MFPNPKEIQTNLCGFLSNTNARIFTGELWKELIGAMGSNCNTRKDSQRITNDKIKSFPRLGPSEKKPQNIETINQKNSFEKKDERHYRSTGSGTESISSDYSSSNNYKYRFETRHRNKIRSRTKSSSRYTPYTRYSRYTESYESSSNSDSSNSNYKRRRRSYSTCSSSSNGKSEVSPNLNSNKEANVAGYSVNSNSSSHVIIISSNYDEGVTEEAYHTDSTESVEIVSKDLSPLQSMKGASPHCYSSQSSSDSVSFVSPLNVQSRQMSRSSYSSSSEYSIEYREKTFFTQTTQYEDNCFFSDIESDSEIEWITIERLRELDDEGHICFEQNCFYFTEQSSYQAQSLSDSDSDSCCGTSSESSTSDIEWVDINQFHQLPGDYIRV